MEVGECIERRAGLGKLRSAHQRVRRGAYTALGRDWKSRRVQGAVDVVDVVGVVDGAACREGRSRAVADSTRRGTRR